MTEVRMSFVVWQDDPAIVGKQAVDYTPQWKNFVENIWTDDARDPSQRTSSSQILQADYNARIEQNDIIFDSSEDAVRFILRWT